MSRPDEQPARARAFCPCCAGTGQAPDEHGDAWIDSACLACYGSGLNYPVDQLWQPWELRLFRWGWAIVVGGTALLAWGLTR